MLRKDSTPAPLNAQRPPFVAIALISLFAITMVLLGAFSVWEGYHTGTTKRGVHVMTMGTPAKWMGGVQIGIGLMMLGIAMPTAKVALRWMLACVSGAGVCLAMALSTK